MKKLLYISLIVCSQAIGMEKNEKLPELPSDVKNLIFLELNEPNQKQIVNKLVSLVDKDSSGKIDITPSMNAFKKYMAELRNYRLINTSIAKRYNNEAIKTLTFKYFDALKALGIHVGDITQQARDNKFWYDWAKQYCKEDDYAGCFMEGWED